MTRKFDTIAMLGDLTREKSVGREIRREGVFPVLFLFALIEVNNCCETNNKEREKECPIKETCLYRWDSFCDEEAVGDEKIVLFYLPWTR